MIKISSKLRKRAQPIIIMLKCDFKKEAEDGLLLCGLKGLILQISGQNTENKNKYTKNMNTRRF